MSTDILSQIIEIRWWHVAQISTSAEATEITETNVVGEHQNNSKPVGIALPGKVANGA